MSAALNVRRYQPGDDAGVKDVIVPIQTQEFGVDITYEDQPDLMDIREFYQNGLGDFWVATTDDEIVGTISLKDIGNSETALRKMFVRKDWRGRDTIDGGGVAKQLLDTLLTHARDSSVKTVFLGTTALFLAAHRFYEKHGFELIDVDDLPDTFPRMAVDTRFYKLDL